MAKGGVIFRRGVYCSQPSIFSYFCSIVDDREKIPRIESRENWTPAENGRLDRIGGITPRRASLSLAFRFVCVKKYRQCGEFGWRQEAESL